MENNISFEEGMEALETLVEKLESGKTSLDESFRIYDEAMKLRKRLEALLDESDRRIRVLTESGEREVAQEDVL